MQKKKKKTFKELQLKNKLHSLILMIANCLDWDMLTKRLTVYAENCLRNAFFWHISSKATGTNLSVTPSGGMGYKGLPLCRVYQPLQFRQPSRRRLVMLYMSSNGVIINAQLITY